MTHPSTTQTRELVVPGRVERQAKRQKRGRRIGLVVLIGLALAIGVPAGKALAHSIDVSAEEVCIDGKAYVDVTVNSQRGDYRFAGTATDTEGHSVPVTIAAGGGSTTVRLGPVTGPGSVRVLGDFYKANGDKAEHMDRSVRYRVLEDCKPKPPPPPPPVQGDAGVTTTCDSVTVNFNGADEGIEQYAKVDGQVRKPASRNGSVTFKGLEPGKHSVEYGSGTNVETGSFEARACKPFDDKGEDFAGTATDKKRTEPNPDDSIPVTPKQPTMGALPFTGPYDYLYPVAGVLLLVGPLLVLAARFRRPKGVQR